MFQDNLIRITNASLKIDKSKAKYIWIGLILAQVLLMVGFPHYAILVFVVSIIGWFGAILYIATFKEDIEVEAS